MHLSYPGAVMHLSYLGAVIHLSYLRAVPHLSYLRAVPHLSYLRVVPHLSYLGAVIHLSYLGAAIHLSYLRVVPHLSYLGIFQQNHSITAQLIHFAVLQHIVSGTQRINLFTSQHMAAPPFLHRCPEPGNVALPILLKPVRHNILVNHKLPPIRVCPPLIFLRYQLRPYKHPGGIFVCIAYVKLLQHVLVAVIVLPGDYCPVF